MKRKATIILAIILLAILPLAAITTNQNNPLYSSTLTTPQTIHY
ncbi:MAG: hypothetical protein ACTSUQ_13665 [Candidatus Freyarchaeota archaeon]